MRPSNVLPRAISRQATARAGATFGGAAAVAAIAATTNWRVALLAAIAAAAIALTRMRYSTAAAITALALVVALAGTARTAGSNQRDNPTANTTRTCGALTIAGNRYNVEARGTSCRRARIILNETGGNGRARNYRCRTHTSATATTTCRRGTARITARR